jgi:triosephosphate isomerase
MKKAKKLVVGNWKMYPERLDDAKKIVAKVRRVMPKVRKTNVVLCPPFVYTPIFSGIKKGNLHLGAQDVNSKPSGSLTGEVSVSQVEQFNVDYVIVGHSERRKMGETDKDINEKLKAVIDYGMTAILCVGEEKRDHNAEYLDTIKTQLSSCLNNIEKKFLGQVVVAYEPVWAIGAKEAMAPRDIHEMTIYIKKVLRDLFGDPSTLVQVLYGGAVDKFNSEGIIREGDVAGFLIGRQSLVAEDFVEIIKIVDKI